MSEGKNTTIWNRTILPVTIFSVLVIGFIAALLVANYVSFTKLQENSLQYYHSELHHRSLELTHLLNEGSHELLTLSHSSILDAFFENQAQAMSIEYGSALLAIQRRLEDFLKYSRHGDKRLFRRILLSDTNGKPLADTRRKASIDQAGQEWLRGALGKEQGFYVCQAANSFLSDLVYLLPYYFRGSLQGQLVLWLDISIFDDILPTACSPSCFSGIVYPESRRILPMPHDAKVDKSAYSALFFSEDEVRERERVLGLKKKILKFDTPLGVTGYRLAEIVSKEAVIGSISPLTLIMVAVILGGIIFTFTVFLLRLMTGNLALKVRIEEAKKREEAIEEKNRLLELEVGGRIQLEARLQEIKKSEAIGRLAGGVAHDLNNILSGIVSYPELLMLKLPPDSDLQTPLKVIQDAGLRASAIVQDLLTLARRGVTVKKVLNLNQLIHTYLQGAEHQNVLREAPHVQISTDLCQGAASVYGASSFLTKTVMNLVANAVESCPADLGYGAEVRISTQVIILEQPFTGYADCLPGQYIHLTVADNGIGLSEADKERIFEPFYTRKVLGRKGTGLGMAVVWGTVSDHDGYIQVETKLGKGTAIHCYFPITTHEPETEPNSSEVKAPYGHGETILVVDDIVEQRFVAREILERLQYQVLTSASGEEAIEYLKTHEVDLLVLDMIMEPGMDGLDTYRHILELHPGQKAIIVSGYSETERVRKVLELGAGQYVSKPYSIEQIAMAVRETLDA